MRKLHIGSCRDCRYKGNYTCADVRNLYCASEYLRVFNTPIVFDRMNNNCVYSKSLFESLL